MIVSSERILAFRVSDELICVECASVEEAVEAR